MKYTIYSDGGCHPPGSAGGAGAVIINEINEINAYATIEEHVWGYKNSTNNRMEMLAAMNAIKTLPVFEKHDIVVYSDSQYLVKGYMEWRHEWKRKNYKKVKNLDLWLDLIDICSYHNITFKWVRGHNGNKYNEIADKLATIGKKATVKQIDKGYVEQKR